MAGPATEQAFLATPLAAAGGGRVIATPFQFYVDGTDHLRIVSHNSLAGVELAVAGRFIDATGGLSAFRFTHTPNTNRSSRTTDHPLGRGYMMNLVAFASAGTPTWGQTYVQVKLIRGLTGATIVLGTLLAGYVTAVQELAWPGSPIRPSTDGPGWARSITEADPPAGSDIVVTVPAGAIWLAKTIYTTLVTDAVAGSRNPYLLHRIDGTAAIYYIGPGSIGPSFGADYFWCDGGENRVVGANVINYINVPPNLRLRGGASYEIKGLGSAGDNFAAPQLQVEEWLEVA